MDVNSELLAEVNAKRIAVLTPLEEQAYRVLLDRGREREAQAIKSTAEQRFSLESRIIRQMNPTQLRALSAALDRGDDASKLQLMIDALQSSRGLQLEHASSVNPER
jgi:hypothetical protein